MSYLISYDLGTGGVKASLYDRHMQTVARSFTEYATYYPQPNYHQQRPADWWQGIAQSTHSLLSTAGVDATQVACISLSGHSLVSVPISRSEGALLEQVPIWSDKRAEAEAALFFQKVDEQQWYLRTGNGFPAACYPLFKLMWMQKHQPDIFAQTDVLLGSKDYINYRLTGAIYTDPSYASGLGAYDLKQGVLVEEWLDVAGIASHVFPPIVPSHELIGHVTAEAAAYTGLAAGTPVACGGVDNACMALGAIGSEEGRSYVSLGSSSWIPVNSSEPVLDVATRPYVFAHIAEGMYTSAYSIFAGGSSLRWVRDQLCSELAEQPDAYDRMNAMAAAAPPGSNGVLFDPSLAGGTSQDASVHIQGSYIGLHLATTRNDLIRAAMEGIAMNLKLSLDLLRQRTPIMGELLFCGGGSRSTLWRQMFADVFDMNIVKTNIDQDAASLGAAAIAARAVGWWNDYRGIADVHIVEHTSQPEPSSREIYQQILPVFQHIHEQMAALGEYMHHHTRKHQAQLPITSRMEE